MSLACGWKSAYPSLCPSVMWPLFPLFSLCWTPFCQLSPFHSITAFSSWYLTQYIIIFKFWPFKNIFITLSPCWHGQTSRRTGQYSTSLLLHLLSSTHHNWLLLLPGYKASPLRWLMTYVFIKIDGFLTFFSLGGIWHNFFFVILIEITLFWFPSPLSCCIFFLIPTLKCWYSLMFHP